MAFELRFSIIPKVISKTNATLNCNLSLPFCPSGAIHNSLPEFHLSTFSLYPFLSGVRASSRSWEGGGEWLALAPAAAWAAWLPAPPGSLASSKGSSSLVSGSCQESPRISNAFRSHLSMVLKISSFSLSWQRLCRGGRLGNVSSIWMLPLLVTCPCEWK